MTDFSRAPINNGLNDFFLFLKNNPSNYFNGIFISWEKNKWLIEESFCPFIKTLQKVQELVEFIWRYLKETNANFTDLKFPIRIIDSISTCRYGLSFLVAFASYAKAWQNLKKISALFDLNDDQNVINKIKHASQQINYLKAASLASKIFTYPEKFSKILSSIYKLPDDILKFIPPSVANLAYSFFEDFPLNFPKQFIETSHKIAALADKLLSSSACKLPCACLFAIFDIFNIILSIPTMVLKVQNIEKSKNNFHQELEKIRYETFFKEFLKEINCNIKLQSDLKKIAEEKNSDLRKIDGFKNLLDQIDLQKLEENLNLLLNSGQEEIEFNLSLVKKFLKLSENKPLLQKVKHVSNIAFAKMLTDKKPKFIKKEFRLNLEDQEITKLFEKIKNNALNPDGLAKAVKILNERFDERISFETASVVHKIFNWIVNLGKVIVSIEAIFAAQIVVGIYLAPAVSIIGSALTVWTLIQLLYDFDKQNEFVFKMTELNKNHSIGPKSYLSLTCSV